MISEREEKIDELFDAVLGLSPAERSEFLAKACGDDQDLRREIESLAVAFEKSQSILEEPVADLAFEILTADEQNRLQINRKIGVFRLIREIGRGGMGAVFLAEREDFRQQVALKIIKRGMDTDEIIRRFRREREVLAALNHPNIARLFDGGTTDDGLPYFVMEYVEDAKPVTIFCEECGLNIEKRLRLFLKICSAVSYIHKNQIVHRDIKPSNILVSKDGEPKLLDFGIAKILSGEESADLLTKTAADMRLFTAEYASPEQVRGENVTQASDIYSLGVLLYELLCGSRPFEFRRNNLEEIVRIVSQTEPTRPSLAFNQKNKIQNPKLLKGDLDNITLKALRKEPENRYESVFDFSEDIRRHLEGLPVSARPLTARYRAAKFIKRNQTAVVFSVLLTMLFAAVGASWIYFLSNSPAAKADFNFERSAIKSGKKLRSIAVLPFRTAGDTTNDESLGADLTDTLIKKLGQMPELEVKPLSAVASFNSSNKTAVETGRDLQTETVLESTLERVGERVKIVSRLFKTADGQILWSETFDEDFAGLFSVQESIAERVAGSLLGQLTVEQRKKVTRRYTDNAEAYKLYLKGKYALDQQSEQSLKQSIQYFNQALDIDPGYALAHAGIGAAYMGLSGVYMPLDEAAAKTRIAAVRALELDPDLAEPRVMLAMVLSTYEWKWAEADAEFKRAIELNPSYASARHWFGRHLAYVGRRDESLAQFKRARELDPLSPYIALDSNFPYFLAGEYDKAIEQINKAVELDQKFWYAYWVRGWANQQKGDLGAAIADYQKAQSIENTPVIQTFLANAYAFSGKRAEAQKILNNLLDIRQRQFIGSPFIAAVYAALDDEEQTFIWLEKGFEERDEWMIWLKYDTRFGKMRQKPHFQDLLRRVGLPN